MVVNQLEETRFEPEYWLEAEPGIVVGYATDRHGKPAPMALLLYRPVSSTTMRSLNLVRYRRPESNWPRFEGSQPPSYQAVLERSGKEAYARILKSLDVHDRRTRESARELLQRIPDESANEFYERVAKAYVLLKDAFGTPVKDMAELAEVPHSTAARWVRQCRLRPKDSPDKFLPPTTVSATAELSADASVTRADTTKEK